jgi:hypothetical protein
MSTCARCGVPVGKLPSQCGVGAGWRSDEAEACAVIECRDRELLALRSLLRSVTGKLEEAAEELAEAPVCIQTLNASALIGIVLEVLS